MESAKKIIPFILVAIVFAVGGYFIGHGNLSDQGASFYGTDIQLVKDPAKKCRRSGGDWVGDGMGGFYCKPHVILEKPSVSDSTTIKPSTTIKTQ